MVVGPTLKVEFHILRLVLLCSQQGEDLLETPGILQAQEAKGPTEHPVHGTTPVTAITGECFTHLLHSHEYIHSIHANSGH